MNEQKTPTDDEAAQQRALERQRRLVATLPKTREQAEKLQRGLTPAVGVLDGRTK